MEFKHIRKGALEYILIDDFYNQSEIDLIKQNLIEIQNDLMPPSKDVDVAVTDDGNPKKNCLSAFLDNLYVTDRSKSNILNVNRKLFSSEVYEFVEKQNASFGAIRHCNIDTTLVNFYNENEKYLPHWDRTVLTILTTFSFGKFEGGEFCFPDFNETIPFKENQTIIFAGCVKHEAKPFKQITENALRISIAQFLNYI